MSIKKLLEGMDALKRSDGMYAIVNDVTQPIMIDLVDRGREARVYEDTFDVDTKPQDRGTFIEVLIRRDLLPTIIQVARQRGIEDAIKAINKFA